MGKTITTIRKNLTQQNQTCLGYCSKHTVT